MTHPVPARAYYLVFAALMVLTVTTVAVTYVELGRLNLIIALLIAFTKATLVVLIFMDVRQSSALTKLVVASGLFWLMIMIVLTFSDYISRDWLPVAEPWTEHQRQRPDVLK
jgi:cytochrome c oxidase subunit IV